MSSPAAPSTTSPRRRFRRRRIAALVLLVAALLLAWLLQPQRSGGFLLVRLGRALDLQITAQGIDYRLRGTPQLTLDGVVVKQPGRPETLLTVSRARIALPWSTLRSGDADLVLDRIELDAPQLDLAAAQRWLAARPPAAAPRIPRIARGLRVNEGRILGDGWRIESIAIALPALDPQQPLRASVRGRYITATVSAPADLAVVIAAPQALLERRPSAVKVGGTLGLAGDGWSLPSQLVLSGPLRIADGSIRLDPAKLGIAGNYRSGTTDVPFRVGLYGALRNQDARWRFDPVTAALAGNAALPSATLRGNAALGDALQLHLDGSLENWPSAWPALPAPLAGSQSAFSLTLDYAGPPTLDAPITLALRRDATRFDARFRRAEVMAWLDAGPSGSPLPPLTGTLRTPRLELPGATLEGVEIELDASPASDARGGPAKP